MNQAEREITGLQRHWPAALHLRLADRFGATRLVEKSQHGPLTLQRAHYPEGGLAHLTLLHPPGGVVGGDELDIRVHHAAHASALYTTPGATKFYAGNGFAASQRQTLTMDANSTLEWFPQENIFFDGAEVTLETDIHFNAHSRFFAWEVNTLGRPAAGIAFASGIIRSRMRLWRDGKLQLVENFVQSVARGNLNHATGLRGHNTMATLFAYPVSQSDLEALRGEFASQRGIFGFTVIDSLLIMRCLEHSCETAKSLLARAWACLRPRMMQREACPPRIWNT